MDLEGIGTPWLWMGFVAFVLAMLGLDLGVFHRKAHEVSVREALIWTAVWISLALLFNLGVYFWFGSERALEFLSGYLIEKSLSVDNIFVFLIIWLGATLIQSFHWIGYVFGAFLVYTGIKLFWSHDSEVHPERNPLFRLF